MADDDGFPTEKFFKLYGRLARGGVGLIITGFAYVTEDGKGFVPGMNGIHTDAHIDAYCQLVAHVHEGGLRIACGLPVGAEISHNTGTWCGR